MDNRLSLGALKHTHLPNYERCACDNAVFAQVTGRGHGAKFLFPCSFVSLDCDALNRSEMLPCVPTSLAPRFLTISRFVTPATSK